jgi:hypothetical protein
MILQLAMRPVDFLDDRPETTGDTVQTPEATDDICRELETRFLVVDKLPL